MDIYLVEDSTDYEESVVIAVFSTATAAREYARTEPLTGDCRRVIRMELDHPSSGIQVGHYHRHQDESE